MVVLDKQRKIINEDKLQLMVRGDKQLTKYKISSKFIDCEPIELVKDTKEDFFKKLHETILTYASNLPHRQVVLKVRKNGIVVEIVINPVTGTA